MAWLLRQGEVLASVEIATSVAARSRVLKERQQSCSVVLISPAKSAHTIGVRFPVDVAHLDEELTVIRTGRLKPNRFGMPHRRARSVLQAEAGSFERWSLRTGDQLELRD